MTDFEPQRGKFAGHGIEVSFIRRFMGDRREDMIESVKVNGRPLVVIDPEDREAVERLFDAIFMRAFLQGKHRNAIDKDYMQAALREFATPTPPKPDEPMGLGAVVLRDGEEWVRFKARSGWWWRNEAGGCQRWDWLADDVTAVLSEGVPDA